MQVRELVPGEQHPHIHGGALGVTKVAIEQPGIEHRWDLSTLGFLQVFHAQGITEFRHLDLELGQLRVSACRDRRRRSPCSRQPGGPAR